MDMAPVIGFLGTDQKAIFSLGCIGHGVSMTTQNGRTIAGLICGRYTERTNMFSVGRKTLALGAFGIRPVPDCTRIYEAQGSALSWLKQVSSVNDLY
jgi:hypothetical protein